MRHDEAISMSPLVKSEIASLAMTYRNHFSGYYYPGLKY